MDTTCAVLIMTTNNQLLVAHSTGNKFYDLPKGLMDSGETPLETVVRECYEETGLQLDPEKLLDLGRYPYNAKKRIHLFQTVVEPFSIDPDTLVCRSMFEHPVSKKMLPEADGFKWIEITKENIESHMAKSMQKLLKNYFGFNLS